MWVASSPSSDHLHVALDDVLSLGAELLGHLLPDLGQDGFLRRIGDHLVHMSADGADEGDAHHPDLQVGRRGVLLGDPEGVDHVEMDAFLPNGLAGVGRQLLPDLEGRVVRLHDEGAVLGQSAQWIGVAEDLVIRRDDDLDVFELRVGDLDGLRTQGDVEIGRGAALLGAVLGRGLGMQTQHAGQDVGEQLAGGDGSVAAHGVKTHPKGLRRQQARIVLRLERHELGFRIGRTQPALQLGDAGRGVVREELGAQVEKRAR